jgi:hypothetical protein
MTNRLRSPIIAFLLPLLLSACAEVRITQPERTATEQLMFSAAVDRVADGLALRIPSGSRVFVDEKYVEGKDSRYLIASLRDRILRSGGNLAATRAAADLVFEPRVGALSVDRRETLVGIPGFKLPVPLVGTLEFPDLALFKKDRQQGVVKLALTSYDAATGSLSESYAPSYAFSHRTDWVVMLFFGWQDNDLIAGPDQKGWIGRSDLD